jgi:Rrf2 family nitric oxide-sensitive transcriptional repressor
MKLNHFTDFSLRILIFLYHKDENKSTSLDELSEKLKISRNHLIKVVQFLANQNLISTKRGKNGGITISEKGKEIQLGNLINLLEQDDSPVINCNTKPCIFQSHKCKLKSFLDVAYQAFLDSLNQYKLADLAFNDWDKIFK